MEFIEVHTQSELDKALKKKGVVPVCKGSGLFAVGDSATVRAGDSATVRAGDSATVRAWDSATVEAWDSATVSAGDSATVRAGDSATVRAWDSATVSAGDSAMIAAFAGSTIEATSCVAIQDHGAKKITGGVIIKVPEPKTAEEWLDYRGVPVKRGVAVLFKVVDSDFKSTYGTDYTPGLRPEALDWDGGVRECGHGLHFCARPLDCLKYGTGDPGRRFVACPVKVKDIVIHKNPAHPCKVKAPKVCAPTYEVDIDGEAL